MRIFLSYCFTSIIFLMVSCSESKETKKEINTEPSESVEHAVAEESTATNEHSLVNKGRKNIQIIRSDEDISLKDFENTTHLYGLGVEKGLKALVVENERVKKYGFTQGELDRYKKEILNNYDQSYRERDKTESDVYARESPALCNN